MGQGAEASLPVVATGSSSWWPRVAGLMAEEDTKPEPSAPASHLTPQRAVEVAGRHAKVPQAPSWRHHARRRHRGAGPG